MTFIFRNRTIFWDISKWNRGQTKWDGGSNNYQNTYENSNTSTFYFTSQDKFSTFYFY